MSRQDISRRAALVGTSGLVLGTLVAVGASGASAAGFKTLSMGSSGGDVKALQNKLNGLGYWCGAADGKFGELLRQAIYAYQSVAGLPRDGVFGPKTAAALNRNLKPGAKGKNFTGLEVDKKRQIVLSVAGGQVMTVLHCSTASGQRFWFYGGMTTAITPSGSFKVQSIVNGWQHGELGPMYKPYYFNGNVAIHGETNVPNYPDSHGCVRISPAAQDMLISYKKLTKDSSIVVY